MFKFPKEPERDFIKRVIGLPGETLELREKKVYINGKPLDEPYVHFLLPPRSRRARRSPRSTSASSTARSRSPTDQYFVMGDNRDNSQDSRYWGYLPRDYIKGKALMVYWSYESDREDYEQDGIGATDWALSPSSHTSSRGPAGTACCTRSAERPQVRGSA